MPRIDNGFFRVSSDGPVALQLGIFDVRFYTSNTIAPSLGKQPTLSIVWIASRRARDRMDVARPCCRPGLAELGTTRDTRVCVVTESVCVSRRLQARTEDRGQYCSVPRLWIDRRQDMGPLFGMNVCCDHHQLVGRGRPMRLSESISGKACQASRAHPLLNRERPTMAAER